MEEEGFLEAPRGRTVNYTNTEGVLICTAWKKISLDASVGTNQPMSAYWKHIKEFFDEHNTSGVDQSSSSLRRLWGTISVECQK